ncbi:sodium- and chloride-dependent transporter XTRP3 [Labeo rohita]|uniref:Transporter n=1 Tax=Labeo rohita TaxID=84645 RepID=A0A498LHK0_LABRO|nr:sodium- and chloride-dependent transporter XTRP3 [Labeo rohita]
MSKEARPSWDSPMQFVLACVSYAVGLGNVWRFPYLCQMHGGGGFLIPYLLMLVLEGIPLFCMELAIGQKMRLGSIGAWTAISPYLGGLGIASVVTSMYLCLYYNVINAWSFWYLFHSFQSVLPWAECPINTNRTGYLEECEVASPTQYFFYRETLNISSSIDENGGIHMGQALCLLLAWIIVYLFIVRGVKSTGMVVYFTATFPYVVLIIYLIRGVTLHGAWNGVKYMFTPKLEQLANPQTWINAATQIFFSLGLGFGSLIAFASYNHHNNNFERQAVAVSLINSGTSVFASVVTFAIYGFKATFNYESCLERMRLLMLNTFDLSEETISAENVTEWIHHLNVTYPEKFASIASKIEDCSLQAELDTAVEGTGLAFIVYSEAIKNMPLSQLWSVLYFVMLLLLGMGSMLGNVTAIITPLGDIKFLSRTLSNETINVWFVTVVLLWSLAGLVCLLCLLLGFGFTSRSGNYWFTIFNEYAATLSLLFIVFIEVGKSVVQEYPVYGQAFIALLLASSLSCVPLAALYAACRKKQRGTSLRQHAVNTVTSTV